MAASQGKFELDRRGNQRESKAEMRTRSARQLTRKPVKDGPGRRVERHLRPRSTPPSDEAAEAAPAAEVAPAVGSPSTSAREPAGVEATGSLDAASTAAAPEAASAAAPAAVLAACSAADAAPKCPAAWQRQVTLAPVSQSAPNNEGDSSIVQRCHPRPRPRPRPRLKSSPHHVATLHLTSVYLITYHPSHAHRASGNAYPALRASTPCLTFSFTHTCTLTCTLTFTLTFTLTQPCPRSHPRPHLRSASYVSQALEGVPPQVSIASSTSTSQQ